MKTLTLDLGLTKPPLTANQRLHHMAKYRETKLLRERVGWLARAHLPIIGRCEIGLVWSVTDKRHRDADNIAPTLKPCIDGLRDAGIIPEDHSQIVVRTWQAIELAPERGMALVITELGAAA